MINKKSLLQRIQSIRSPREKVDVYNPFLWEYLLENPGEALLLVQTAVDLAQENHYDDGYYQALMNRGYCYLYTGQFDHSWNDFNELLRYHRLQEDTLGEIRVLNALGLTAQKRGWFRTAGDCFRQSLIKSRQTGHSEREYVALANQADLFLHQGAPQEAFSLLDTLMSLLQEEELAGYRAVIKINMGRWDYAAMMLSILMKDIKVSVSLCLPMLITRQGITPRNTMVHL